MPGLFEKIRRFIRRDNAMTLDELAKHTLAPDDPRAILNLVLLYAARDHAGNLPASAAVTHENIRAFITARSGEPPNGCEALSDAELWRRARQRLAVFSGEAHALARTESGDRRVMCSVETISATRYLVILRDGGAWPK